jgi:hypothetical protein
MAEYGEPGVIRRAALVTTGAIVCHASMVRPSRSARSSLATRRFVGAEQALLETGRCR